MESYFMWEIFPTKCGNFAQLVWYFFSFSAREIIGGENEHIAFLWSHALELQGQVLKAFVNSVIYKFLDPEVFLSSFLDSKHLNTSLSQWILNFDLFIVR